MVKPLTRAQADARLTRLRKIALALPETSEKLSHGAPTFWVADKRVFIWFMHDHHGSGITGLCVKTSSREEQLLLLEADPLLHYKPAYIGAQGWIGLNLNAAPDWDHVADRVAGSWRLAAPPKLLKNHPLLGV
jgi:phosphoribosylglycinamide formyltransferase 1